MESSPIIPEDRSRGLLYTSVEYLLNTLVYTLFSFAGFALICILPILVIFTELPEYTGYTTLILLGWSIVFSQVNRTANSQEEEEDISSIEKGFGIAFLMLYFNISLLVVIGISNALTISSGGALGISAALFLPFMDIELVRRELWELSPIGIGLVVTLWIGDKVDSLYQALPLQELLSKGAKIVSQTRKAHNEVHATLVAHQLGIIQKTLKTIEEILSRPLKLRLDPYRGLLKSKRHWRR